MALTGAQALIGMVGLRRSTAALWWLVDHLPAPRPVQLESRPLAEATARSIARIADRLPSRPRCLPRALVMASLLRRRHIAAELCLGTRVSGAFEAHAWVEFDGCAVCEPPDLQTTFKCLWRSPVLGAPPGGMAA